MSRVGVLVLAAVLLTAGAAAAQGPVAMVYDAVADSGFGEMAVLGGERAARDFGVNVAVVVADSPSEYASTLRGLAASREHDVIIAVGFPFAEAIALVAGEFPEQDFALIDAEVEAPNVMNVVFAEHEGGALAGALAAFIALESGSDTVGIVLGMDVPPLRRFAAGYEWGARWAAERYNERNPARPSPATVKVLAEYTGSFSNPELGKKAALAQLEKGAAVIFNAAGATGLGVFEAVREAAQADGRRVGPPFAVGVDSIQEYIAPGFVPASVVKRVDTGVYAIVERALSGTFAGGTLRLDLKSGGLGLSTSGAVDELLEFAMGERLLDGEGLAGADARVEEARRRVPPYAWQLVAELERVIAAGEVALE